VIVTDADIDGAIDDVSNVAEDQYSTTKALKLPKRLKVSYLHALQLQPW
jgi:hypothetical protein